MTMRSVSMTRIPALPDVGMRVRAFAGQLPAFGRDFAVVITVIGVYFLLRAQAPGNDSFAVALTAHLVDFEQRLHVFWEPTIQDWSIRVHFIQEIANGIYAYGHFPVLAAVGAW